MMEEEQQQQQHIIYAFITAWADVFLLRLEESQFRCLLALLELIVEVNSGGDS